MYTAIAQRPARPVASSPALRAGVAPSATDTARAPRTRLSITRRGRIVLAALVATPLVVGLLAVGINAGGAVATSESPASSFQYETIDAGETLWHLAQSVAPAADPRDVIADILRLNGLDTATVVPGQRIAIPTQYS